MHVAEASNYPLYETFSSCRVSRTLLLSYVSKFLVFSSTKDAYDGKTDRVDKSFATQRGKKIHSRVKAKSRYNYESERDLKRKSRVKNRITSVRFRSYFGRSKIRIMV